MEGDDTQWYLVRIHRHFNPLPPHGGRLAHINQCDSLVISIHSLRMEGDTFSFSLPRILKISIHSLRMEGDAFHKGSGCIRTISIHSLRMEGDCRHRLFPQLTTRISIHSLRMEGDLVCASVCPVTRPFQSTPSAWRETRCPRLILTVYGISIHSLRMEGDRHRLFPQLTTRNFNPLPPHGGRRYAMVSGADSSSFQSTPSAWRETICRQQRTHLREISIHSLRMEGDSKTAQESVFHFAYPCTILQKRMQKTTFCTRKNGFFRKKGEKFGAKPSASFCAPMIRTDTFPLNFSHRISGSSMSMVSFAPICSTFD